MHANPNPRQFAREYRISFPFTFFLAINIAPHSQNASHENSKQKLSTISTRSCPQKTPNRINVDPCEILTHIKIFNLGNDNKHRNTCQKNYNRNTKPKHYKARSHLPPWKNIVAQSLTNFYPWQKQSTMQPHQPKMRYTRPEKSVQPRQNYPGC